MTQCGGAFEKNHSALPSFPQEKPRAQVFGGSPKGYLWGRKLSLEIQGGMKKLLRYVQSRAQSLGVCDLHCLGNPRRDKRHLCVRKEL